MKIKILIAALLIALSPVSFAKAQSKPTIVLVHGAWETSAVWQQVAHELRADQYKVIAVDLPGRPSNPLPIDKVTLQLYQQTVSKAIASQQSPVVLVGHSFGGFTISNEAEAEPSKIKTLVYIAAYIPEDGESMLTLASQDKGSHVPPTLSINKSAGTVSVLYAARAGLFANDASPDLGKLVADSLVDEPLAPLATPVHLTNDRFGSVDKVYIETLRDQVISPDFQMMMVQRTKVKLVLTINTGHTPFFTQPQLLAWEIEKAAQ
jgi:pimeloyl-ACP methyl ester carboxylesterase